MIVRSLIVCLIGLASCAGSAQAELVFSVSFTPQAQAALSVSQQMLFVDAVGFWDSIIIGHRDNVARTWNLSVDTFSQAANGNGGVLLGFGGYSSLGLTNVVAGSHTSDGRFYISTGGQVTFNTHPDAGVLSSSLLRHEVAHALGFGSLWELNQVYNDGIAGNTFRTLAAGVPGQYVGPAGLAAYQREFRGQANASFVPVELAGGPGTAHGHWDERDDAGQSLTGIVNADGRDFRDELMTGWASFGENAFVSQTTVGSLEDIGFSVASVPEPAGWVALFEIAVAWWLCGGRRSRRVFTHVAAISRD